MALSRFFAHLRFPNKTAGLQIYNFTKYKLNYEVLISPQLLKGYKRSET